MIKKIILSVAMLAVATPAFAQVGIKGEVRAEVNVGVRPTSEQRAEAQPIGRPQPVGPKPMPIREEMKVNAEAREAKMAEVKVEMKAKMETRQMELKEKLKVVKDERKRTVVAGLDTKINALNAKVTGEMSATLTKLSDILVRISEKGGDVTEATAAVVSAQAAVDAQASVSYSITITTEEKLRADVDATQKALRVALAATQEKVKTAKEWARKAVAALEASLKVSAEAGAEVKY